jgi:hypothetical protein
MTVYIKKFLKKRKAVIVAPHSDGAMENEASSGAEDKTTPQTTKRKSPKKAKATSPDFLSEFLADFKKKREARLLMGVCEMDDPNTFDELLDELNKERKPVGPTQKFWVESLASSMTRTRRIRLQEAEFINSLVEPKHRIEGIPRFPAVPACAEELLIYGRAEAMLLKGIQIEERELERSQKRNGLSEPQPTIAGLEEECTENNIEETNFNPEKTKEEVDSGATPIQGSSEDSKTGSVQ